MKPNQRKSKRMAAAVSIAAVKRAIKALPDLARFISAHYDL